MTVFRRFLLKNKTILMLSFIYFLFRLINLTSIPIFNDEAIYLDWGWREIHYPNNLFYSLFDGKQPFLMWMFGISESFFSDPLFAGRLISVITGFLTGLGIYYIGKKYFGRNIARYSFLFYIVIPLFSFFDRQALMESAISSVGVWSCYFLINIFNEKDRKSSIMLGIILGIGFFIKSTVLIFFISAIILSFFYLIKQADKQKKKIIQYIFLSFLISQIILIFLYTQDKFWSSLSMNNRYSLTITEIMSFPFSRWFQTIKNSLELEFWYLTPLPLILGTAGIINIFKRNTKRKYIACWFLINMIFMIFFARDISARYIVPFLPLFTIFICYFLFEVLKTKKTFSMVLFFLYVLFPSLITIVQIFSPLDYFYFLDKLTKLSQKQEYVAGWTSGYGVRDTYEFIKEKNKNNFAVVGVRLDAGNPENAIFTYFYKEANIKPIFLDSKGLSPNILSSNCIKSNIPIYFVSRSNQLAGLDKFLYEIKRFYKPEGKEYIGIYRLRNDCKDKVFIR